MRRDGSHAAGPRLLTVVRPSRAAARWAPLARVVGKGCHGGRATAAECLAADLHARGSGPDSRRVSCGALERNRIAGRPPCPDRPPDGCPGMSDRHLDVPPIEDARPRTVATHRMSHKVWQRRPAVREDRQTACRRRMRVSRDVSRVHATREKALQQPCGFAKAIGETDPETPEPRLSANGKGVRFPEPRSLPSQARSVADGSARQESQISGAGAETGDPTRFRARKSSSALVLRAIRRCPR